MAEPEQLQTKIPSVLEDPSVQAVARVYADAFLDAVGENGESALEEFGSFLDDVLAKHPELERILMAGMLNRDDKLGIIERVVAPFGSEIFTNFLRVLARHERMELLPVILREGWLKWEIRQGNKRVRVCSSEKLTEETMQRIGKTLGKKFSFKPILIPEVDKQMLGGVVIQIDDTVYDSSLRTRLKQLQERLRQRSLNEIQSGRDRFSHSERD